MKKKSNDNEDQLVNSYEPSKKAITRKGFVKGALVLIATTMSWQHLK